MATIVGMTTQPTNPGWHVPSWTFADRLRKIRRETGLTQADFAGRIGVGDKAYGAWESGANQPGDIVAVAKRIELAFRVPASWVLGLGPFASGDGGGPDGAGPRGDDPQSPKTLLRSYRTLWAA